METAIKLDPHHADALNYLGYSYADRGIKMDQALLLTKQAVALKPDNGYYVDSLGWAYFKSGMLTEALAELKRAAALVGDDPVIYEHLGDIYAKMATIEYDKALALDSSVLLLDEPTAAITPHEVAFLFDVLRGLRDRGVAILFVTHKLEEVFELCDRVTVLRDGCVVETRAMTEVSRPELIRMIRTVS